MINGIGNAKQAELSLVITRADGSTEDLGVVSYYSKNPLKRAIFKIKQMLGIKISSKINPKKE